ncbi:hypothetical protein LLEC1_05099 [Akanthomyces lecanii]|uniref:Uncharacterized protein n=1 Tax=Cordyceps confragosa TaxID=2714763 RepID=A0A179IFD5_CORDF|nr:hypothetical protein LLEC1_05099 [Akanthomyces lecanii]
MYTHNPGEKTNIITSVVAQAPAGAASAVVVNGWHTSRSDWRTHCTVDYYDANDNKLSREHIEFKLGQA